MSKISIIFNCQMVRIPNVKGVLSYFNKLKSKGACSRWKNTNSGFSKTHILTLIGSLGCFFHNSSTFFLAKFLTSNSRKKCHRWQVHFIVFVPWHMIYDVSWFAQGNNPCHRSYMRCDFMALDNCEHDASRYPITIVI
jgi:hypothetical protein